MPEELKNDDPQTFDWDNYPETRKKYDDVRIAQLNAFDKAVLAISTSALGASLYLLSSYPVAHSISDKNFLVTSWAGFTLAVVLNLISYLLGASSAKHDIVDLDDAARRNVPANYRRNSFVQWTEFTTIGALIAFIVGVVALCYFAFSNAGL